jgi:choline dehydrogenase-like flavoprotein
MIRDFLTYDGSAEIECDLCIAGAGPAGITIALAVAEKMGRVVLLESGGFELEDATQDLYTGRNIGLPYYELNQVRLRMLGGSSNHWGGISSPLDPIDFEPRSWVPYSGWPIGRADLEPYLSRANSILDLGASDYSPETIVPEGGSYQPFSADRLVHKIWRYSVPPTNVGQKYRADLEGAANIDLLLHANLTEIETDDNAATVTGFRIMALDGRSTRVRAKAYVLALGGIENPRLLMVSNRVIPSGLGNQNDLVGRFFMEHLDIDAGTVLSVKGDWYESYLPFTNAGQQVLCAVRPSPAAQAREQILNTAAMFGQVRWHHTRSPGYQALHEIKEEILHGHVPDHLGTDLWKMLTDLDGVVLSAWEKVDPTTYIVVTAEEAPHPDSRVVLADERDALGLRRVNLDWRPQPIDKRTIQVVIRLIGEELGRLGLGRAQIADWIGADEVTWTEQLVGGFHQIGTTRMADDPSRGVVDRDCRVFGTDNLYLAGSSVFPTGGCANPTLNLVALALRLADQLKDQVPGWTAPNALRPVGPQPGALAKHEVHASRAMTPGQTAAPPLP